MLRQIRFLPSENIHGRLLPWVIAVMVFLAGLAMLVALGLQMTARTWHQGLAQSLTVQVINADRTARDKEVAAALAELRKTPGVASAEEETGEEVAALLEPWLGKGNVGPDLPIPALIDVRVADGHKVDAAALGAGMAIVHLINQRLEGALLPQLLPPPEVLASLLVLPIVAGLLTMLTARFAVMRALSDMN